MSMSTHVVAIVPPDERWKKMRDAWVACESAGVPVPADVLAFFNHEKPDPAGVTIHLRYDDAGKQWAALREWRDKGHDGYEVEIEKLPPHIKVLRFYNSW